MRVLLDYGGDVVQYQAVDLSAGVIPIEVDAQVFCACPILGDCVVLFEYGYEVLGVLLADVLYAEIIDAQGKRNWAS